MTTFDVASSGKITSTALTVSHTIGSGSNRVLIVFGGVGKNPESGVTASCTYGGVAMTSLGLRHSGDISAGLGQAFIMIDPPTGTANIVLTASASSDLTLGGMSFSDASQTLGDYTLTTAAPAGTTFPITRSGTTSGSMIAFGGVCGNSINAITQTQQYVQNINANTAASNGAGATASGTGSSVAWQFGTPGGSDTAAMFAVEVLTLAGGGGPVRSTPQIRSTNTFNVNTGTSLTIPLPSSWQVGDLCYICWAMTATAGVLTPPSGWTEVVPQFSSASNVNAVHGVLRRILQAGDTDPVVTVITGRFAAVSIAIFDHDPEQSEDVTPVGDNNSGVVEPNSRAPSITPVTDGGCLLITNHTVRNTNTNDPTGFTPPAGMTEIAEATATTSTVAAIGVMKLILTDTSATGVKNATATGINVTALDTNGSSIVVRGAPPFDYDFLILLSEDGYPISQETGHHLLLES